MAHILNWDTDTDDDSVVPSLRTLTIDPGVIRQFNSDSLHKFLEIRNINIDDFHQQNGYYVYGLNNLRRDQFCDYETDLSNLINSHNYFLTAYEPYFFYHYVSTRVFQSLDQFINNVTNSLSPLLRGDEKNMVITKQHFIYVTNADTTCNIVKTYREWHENHFYEGEDNNGVPYIHYNNEKYCPLCCESIEWSDTNHMSSCLPVPSYHHKRYIDNYYMCLVERNGKLEISDYRIEDEVFYYPLINQIFYLNQIKTTMIDQLWSVLKEGGFIRLLWSLHQISLHDDPATVLCQYCDNSTSFDFPISANCLNKENFYSRCHNCRLMRKIITPFHARSLLNSLFYTKRVYNYYETIGIESFLDKVLMEVKLKKVLCHNNNLVFKNGFTMATIEYFPDHSTLLTDQHRKVYPNLWIRDEIVSLEQF